MNLSQDMAVQSYCFRGTKDNAEVAKQVQAIGLRSIELCGVHVDFNDPDSRAAAIATYRDAGVGIVSGGVNRIGSDAEAARPLFEFVKAAGARFMSIDFDINEIPASLRVAEQLAEEYDVRLAIHNHGGRHPLGSAGVLKWVFAQCSERIGLCVDTAWALDSGEEPVAFCKRFADRLYGLHIKDFIFDRARKPSDVVIGTGNLDLPGLAALMAEIDFDGYAVLEYEGDIENPVPALTECVEVVKGLSA